MSAATNASPIIDATVKSANVRSTNISGVCPGTSIRKRA